MMKIGVVPLLAFYTSTSVLLSKYVHSQTESDDINPDIWLNLSSHSDPRLLNHSIPAKEKDNHNTLQKEIDDTATSTITPTKKRKRGRRHLELTEEERRKRRLLSNRLSRAKHRKALVEKVCKR